MADDIQRSELIAEFVGIYLLVFTVGCNVMCQVPVWGGVSIACVLMVCIYAFGGISGANFNPAVSFALGLVRTMGGGKEGAPLGMPWAKVGAYIAVQLTGGLAAGLSYLALFQNSFNLQPAYGFGILSAGACEFYYTFMLVFVVLNVAVATKVAGNQYYGLAIGFVVVAGAYGAGNVSGGCFNPAVAFGIDVSSAFIGIGWFVIYWIFEFAGAALAVVLFREVRPTEFGGEEGTLMNQCLSEFLGTYMLVVTVGLNVLGKSVAAAFSIAAALMCMIFALGDVSGAHFNPAVTLAIFISKMDPSLDVKKMGAYMASQIVGGITAAISYAFVYHWYTFPLGPGEGFGWTQVAVAEVIFTFVLCLVVLCVADGNKATHAPTMFGLAIGSCVTVGGFAIGGISGGSLNPAVSFGIASAQILNGGIFYKALLYSAFEFAGAALAAGAVSVTHPKPALKEEPPTP
jgi:aquaporin Z